MKIYLQTRIYITETLGKFFNVIKWCTVSTIMTGGGTQKYDEKILFYTEYTAVEIFTVFDITGLIPLQIIIKTVVVFVNLGY